jgi:hypothetical protein
MRNAHYPDAPNRRLERQRRKRFEQAIDPP